MDLKGQALCDSFMFNILLFSGVLAFIISALIKYTALVVYIYALGVVIGAAVTIIDWPFYNKNPLTFKEQSQQAPATEFNKKIPVKFKLNFKKK